MSLFRRLACAKISTQLCVWLTVYIVSSSALIYLALRFLDQLLGDYYTSKLPAHILSIRTRLNQGQPVSASEIQQAQKVFSDLGDQLERIQYAEFAAMVVLAALVGIGFVFFLARRLTAPLERLGQASSLIAKGDLSARVVSEDANADEIKRLIDGFNQMASALAAYEHERSATAAAVAHELRTPLTILRGRLQGMLDGYFAADADNFTALIDQVDGLGRLVEDLRVLSLFETNKLVLVPRLFDLAEELESIIQLVSPDFMAAGIAIETDLPTTLFIGDKTRIRQAALALLDNALKYAAIGKSVKIGCGAKDATVWFQVVDRGPGLVQGATDHVFERFWRAEPSRSRASGGSGLGLSVVKSIALAHGGNVEALPRKGGGMIFQMVFPVRED
jgi:two-component system sensor histidine kinase BaeS/two-component system sensor histidine kinase AdeS